MIKNNNQCVYLEYNGKNIYFSGVLNKDYILSIYKVNYFISAGFIEAGSSTVFSFTTSPSTSFKTIPFFVAEMVHRNIDSTLLSQNIRNIRQSCCNTYKHRHHCFDFD